MNYKPKLFTPLNLHCIPQCQPFIHAGRVIEYIGIASACKQGISNGCTVAALAMDHHFFILADLVEIVHQGSHEHMFCPLDVSTFEFSGIAEVYHLNVGFIQQGFESVNIDDRHRVELTALIGEFNCRWNIANDIIETYTHQFACEVVEH